MTLGEALRTARQAAGLTQEAVAFEAKIDRAYLSQLENDRKSPTVETLFLICRALKVRASEIISQVEEGSTATDE